MAEPRPRMDRVSRAPDLEQRLLDWTRSEQFLKGLPPAKATKQKRILGIPVKNWQAKLIQARMNMIRKRMEQLSGGVGEFLRMPSRAFGAIGRSLSPQQDTAGRAGVMAPDPREPAYNEQMYQEMGGGYSIEPPPRQPILQQPPLPPPPQPIQRSPWRP